jgi:L-ascorbate oxidase
MIDGKIFDPNRVDHRVALGAVEEWTILNQQDDDHVFHIHVNPFQVMDIKDSTSNQSIFDASGACKAIYLQPTVPDSNNPSGPPVANPLYSPEYCDQYHVFRDTLFLKPNFLVTARTAYDDFIGQYVLHCHILDHEDQGMMQNVTIVSSANQESTAPLQTQMHAQHH